MKLGFLDEVMQDDKWLDTESVTGGLEILFKGREEVGGVFLAVDVAEDLSKDREFEFFMGLVNQGVSKVGLSGWGE